MTKLTWNEEWNEPPDVSPRDEEERESVLELEIEAGIEADPSDEEGIPEDDLCDADTTPVPRRDA